MMSDADMLWLLAIGLAVISSGKRAPIPWGSGWVWPVPSARAVAGIYPAVISQEYRAPSHMGVDIMYRRTTGAREFFAPEHTPILAARAGKVWSVDLSPRGWEVVLDHGKPFATYYQHLSAVAVKPGDVVSAGQQIGTMGIDPLDSGQVRHLHFAVWFDGAGDAASVDPQVAMSGWPRGAPWNVTA